MYIDKDMAEKLLKEGQQSMISEMKEKSDFLLALLESDDWSLVIKSHAFIESVVTELVVTKIDEPKLKKFVERRPLGEKLSIAVELDLISKNARNFVNSFSQLRNMLVHKVENFGFDFSSHIKKLNKKEQGDWGSTYTWYERDSQQPGQNSWKNLTLDKPRVAVFMAIFMFVMLHNVNNSEIKILKSIDLCSQETMRKLFDQE